MERKIPNPYRDGKLSRLMVPGVPSEALKDLDRYLSKQGNCSRKYWLPKGKSPATLVSKKGYIEMGALAFEILKRPDSENAPDRETIV